jgi:ribosomal protein S18 acetylase RimI-like enzyme
MLSEIQIRNYNSEDKNVLLELLRLNTPTYFSPDEESDFISYLDNYILAYFVVEIEGEIIGCGGINVTENQKTGVISWDIIHPNFQGKGIGKHLLEHRIKFLKTNYLLDEIIVRTSQHTVDFYCKSGFELQKITKDYWAKGFDLYLMKLIF